jgi:hypothetical protein
MPSSTPAVALTREQLVGLEQILRKLDVRSAGEFMLAPAKRERVQPERKADGSINWQQNLVAWKDAAGKARNKAGAWITHCVTEGHPKGCTCNLLDPAGIMALPARATAPERKVPTAAFPAPQAAPAPVADEDEDLAEQIAGMFREDTALFARVIALMSAPERKAAPAPAPAPEPKPAAAVAGAGERICRKGHVAPARDLCPTCAALKAAKA